MRADHEEFLKTNVPPATLAFASIMFDTRLRELLEGSDEEAIEATKFLCILSFVYGTKALMDADPSYRPTRGIGWASNGDPIFEDDKGAKP